MTMNKAPICENCDVQMVTRYRRADNHPFYGCPNWPKCDNTEQHEDEDPTDNFGNMSYIDTLQ